MRRYAGIVTMLACTTLGVAQESPDSAKVYSLGEVVITATRSQIPLRDSPSAVDILSRPVIEIMNGSTVAEVLKNTGGLFLREYGANAALKTLSLRGSASEQVLVLVNGARFGNFQNDLVDLSLLASDDVERIEVVHGGTSALYGADALGGVINILTRRAGGEARVRTEISSGSFGFERYMVSGEGRMGDLGIRAGYSSERGRDDFDYTQSTTARDTSRRNSDFARRQFSLSSDMAIDSRSSLVVSIQDAIADRGAPGAIGPFESDVARQNDHDVNLVASYSDAHLERLNLSVRTSVHYNYETYLDPNPGYPINSFYKNLDGTFNPQCEFLASASEKIIGGLEIGQGTLDGNDFDSRITRVQQAIYLSSESMFDFKRDVLDRLSVFGTLRYDHVTDVDHAFNPKLGVNLRLLKAGDLRFRASGGGNFRSPTFNDLYYRGFNNPGLKPERSTSLDAGLLTSVAFGDVASDIDVTYFYLDTKDRIFFDTRTFRPENIGRAESRGWECRLGARLFRSMVSAGVSYTKTDAIKKNPTADNDPTVGNQLPYVPITLVHFSLSADLKTISFNLVHSITGGRFTDDTNTEELPPYRLTNLNVVVRNGVGKWTCSFKGEINNLFDEEYEVFKDYPMPKRNFRMTLAVECTP